MLRDIECVPTSILRNIVSQSYDNNTVDVQRLNRKECLRALKAKGILHISDNNDSTADNHALLYNSSSGPISTNKTCTTIEESIQQTDDSPDDECYRIQSDVDLPRFPMSILTTDAALHHLTVQHELFVYNKLYLLNGSLEIRSEIEESLNTLKGMMTDMSNIRTELNKLVSTIDDYSNNTNIQLTNEMGTSYPLQISYPDDGNISCDRTQAHYIRNDSIIHIDIHLRISKLQTVDNKIAVILPSNVDGDLSLYYSTPYIRAIIQTGTMYSTISRVYVCNQNMLFVESVLFSSNSVYPLDVHITGSYKTTFTDRDLITPMRFDLIRYIQISPSLLTYNEQHLRYITGKIQWNRIEERIDVVLNLSFDILLSSITTHDIMLTLPSIDDNIAHTAYSGHGSVLLYPSNQYVVQPPFIKLNIDDQKLLIQQIRTNTETQQMHITAHIIYYSSNEDDKFHRFDKPILHGNVLAESNNIIISSVNLFDGYNHELQKSRLSKVYDIHLYPVNITNDLYIHYINTPYNIIFEAKRLNDTIHVTKLIAYNQIKQQRVKRLSPSHKKHIIQICINNRKDVYTHRTKTLYDINLSVDANVVVDQIHVHIIDLNTRQIVDKYSNVVLSRDIKEPVKLDINIKDNMLA